VDWIDRLKGGRCQRAGGTSAPKRTCSGLSCRAELQDSALGGRGIHHESTIQREREELNGCFTLQVTSKKKEIKWRSRESRSRGQRESSPLGDSSGSRGLTLSSTVRRNDRSKECPEARSMARGDLGRTVM